MLNENNKIIYLTERNPMKTVKSVAMEHLHVGVHVGKVIMMKKINLHGYHGMKRE